MINEYLNEREINTTNITTNVISQLKFQRCYNLLTNKTGGPGEPDLIAISLVRIDPSCLLPAHPGACTDRGGLWTVTKLIFTEESEGVVDTVQLQYH